MACLSAAQPGAARRSACVLRRLRARHLPEPSCSALSSLHCSRHLLSFAGPILYVSCATPPLRRFAASPLRRCAAPPLRRRCLAAAAAAAPIAASSSSLAALQDQLRLPVLLVLALVLGVQNPAPGAAAAQAGGVAFATSLVFLITGLALKPADVREAWSAKGAALFAASSTLLLSPLLALPLLRLQPALLPSLPPEFAAGLAAMLCMPTTLSTGVILTQQVGANAALALALVVLTNCVAVFLLPFSLQTVFGAAGAAAIDPLPLVLSLARTMLAPLALGSAVRALVPGAAARADALRPASKLLQQLCLVATPWMSVSLHSAALASLAAAQCAAACAAAAAAHLLLLLLNAAAARALGLGGRGGGPAADRVRRPVVLTASQKTLPVAVTVLSQLGPALGSPGLAVLPCIAFHLLQILIDSALCSWWQAGDAARARAKAAA